MQRGLVVLVHLDRREVEVWDVLPREPYLAAEPFPSFVQAILPGVAILGGMQDGTAIYSIGDVDGRDERRKHWGRARRPRGCDAPEILSGWAGPSRTTRRRCHASAH